MKKTLLSVFFVVISFAVYADDDTREIELYSIDITTRSITVLPEASISRDILAVSFDNSGIYSLYIEDNLGEMLYTSTLPADGMEYSYDLSGIGEGLFRLIIKGPGGEFEGYFMID